MRDRAAARALVLGLLGLPFGVFAPFAVFTGARSLRRIRSAHGELSGETAALLGLAAGLLGLVSLIAGVIYWFLAS
jgi:hypothetical protein